MLAILRVMAHFSHEVQRPGSDSQMKEPAINPIHCRDLPGA
jgi:hypothetical protein